MNAIEVAGLAVRRGGAEVLSDLTFTVAAGSYLAVVGPNGSGKTTLLRALLGLERPSAGTIRLFGQPQDRFHDWRRIGYLPQVGGGRQQTLPATVAELVATGLIAGKPFPKRLTRADLERVDEVLDGLGIHDLRRRLIGRLSGGQQQRVLLARALVCRPELLLLDEPTLALDPQSRDEFYRSIDERHRVSGVTVVLVTHDTGSVGAFASHMLYLDRRLVFHGTFTEFCRSAAMAEHFGRHAQHVICHQHRAGDGANPEAGDAADGEPCGTC